MKHFTLSILFSLFTFCLHSQFIETDWMSLNLNEPEGKYVRSTSVVNENVIWGLILEQDPSYPIAVGNQFFRTLDGGQTFEIDTLPFSSDGIFTNIIQAIDENIAFVNSIPGGAPFIEGIYMTPDGGQNWELIYDADALQIQPIIFHFFNDSEGTFIGVAQEGNSLVTVSYYTQDGGNSWTPFSGTLNSFGLYATGGNNIQEVVGDTIWISSDLILRSTDKGQTWEEFDTGVQNFLFADIAFKDALNGLAISPGNFGTSENVLIQTNDGGETWSEIDFSTTLGVMQLSTIEYIPGTEGSYIISNGDLDFDASFFAFTNDDGATWEIGLADYKLYCTDFLSASIGFGGSDISTGGLLKFNDEIFDEMTSLELLADDELNIFPNPTQDFLNIELDNEMHGNLTLRIVNTLGQTVLQQYISKNQNEERWEINLSKLPIGNYQLMVSNRESLIVKSITKF